MEKPTNPTRKNLQSRSTDGWKEHEAGKPERPLREVYDRGIEETRQHLKNVFDREKKPDQAMSC